MAQFEGIWRLCGLRQKNSPPRITRAALLVAANLFRVVVKRDSDRRRHRPDAKRLRLPVPTENSILNRN